MAQARLKTFLLLLLLAPVIGRAQEALRPERVNHIWTSVQVNGGLPGFMDNLFGRSTHKRVRLSGELGYRSGEGVLQGRQIFTDVGARYKLTKDITIGLEHRYAMRFQQTNRNRTGIQVMYDRTFDRLEIGYRFNYQHNYRPFGSKREVFRNRVQVAYDIAGWKLDPEASVESFTWAGYLGWNYIGIRYKVGTSYKLSRSQRLTFDLVHDREINIAWPKDHWIVSFGYVMDLRKF